VRAAVHHRYGGPEVLQLEEVDAPVPRDDEVLVRVRATTVNRTDCGFRRADPFFVRALSGLRRPRRPILGTELAGEVEAIGAAVTELAVGDRVFGVNADRFGAHAELLCVRERAPLATMPEGLGFEEAAAVCDGIVLADTCLSWAKVGAGQQVLVYGADGAIGSAGVQLADVLGAEVTAACASRNVEVVRSLGPARVIDREREDIADGTAYDVVFDAVGKLSFGRARRSLRRGGVFVSTDFGPRGQIPFLAAGTWLTSRLGGTRRVLLPLPRYSKAHVLLAKDLLERGRYRPVIDRRYPLEEIVEATRYVETGQKTGNVVIVVG
jgi:NADPH:quinone reductase-like Zn-dependent oxidoreductase